MAQVYPNTHSSNLQGASRSTIESDASSLLPLLDTHPSLSIFTKSTPGFEEIRETCNSNITIQPLAIIRPRAEAEVSSIVSYCVNQTPRIQLAIRAGGHDMYGRSLVEDGVVIDLREINFIKVSEDKSSVQIGGGTLSGPLLEELESLGLSTPSGFCTSVGYAGWALGGGYGVLRW